VAPDREAETLDTIAVHPCEQYCSDAHSAARHHVLFAQPVTMQKRIKKGRLRGFLLSLVAAELICINAIWFYPP